MTIELGSLGKRTVGPPRGITNNGRNNLCKCTSEDGLRPSRSDSEETVRVGPKPGGTTRERRLDPSGSIVLIRGSI